MKAVICGAGIAGLALAHRLATQGWDITLLEQAPEPRTQGYMIDFFGVGYDAAEQMGVLPRLAEHGYQVDELRYHDNAGRTRARLNYRRISDALDGRVFSIMRPDMEAVLRDALPAGVRQLFDTSVRLVDIRVDSVGITTTDGHTLHADLLVGTDGIHSRVRDLALLHGIRAVPRPPACVPGPRRPAGRAHGARSSSRLWPTTRRHRRSPWSPRGGRTRTGTATCKPRPRSRSGSAPTAGGHRITGSSPAPRFTVRTLSSNETAG